jgi:L,D-transpeptidase catalytic domain
MRLGMAATGGKRVMAHSIGKSGPQILSRRLRLAMTTFGLIVLAGLLLNGCGAGATTAATAASKARLDAEIARATRLGLSATVLTPVTSSAQHVDSTEPTAAAHYDTLYKQLLGIETANIDIIKKTTTSDLDALAAQINEKRAQGFVNVALYQQRLAQALGDLQNATTASDFARVDDLAIAQLAGLHAISPTLQKLQDLQVVTRSMKAAGADITLAQQFASQDQKDFTQATSGFDYTRLNTIIDGQITQLMADQTAATPFIATAMLKTFQTRIDQLRQYNEGATADAMQQKHDDLAKQLGQASKMTDYLTLVQHINQQESAMALPFARGQAHHDLDTLMSLIATGENQKAGGYPVAYEYADRDVGYGDAMNAVNKAKTVDDFIAADDQVRILSQNLQALLDNLNDTTPRDQAHQTDLRLMNDYGAMQGKAIVVSLREQTARFYEDGKLIFVVDVTTGRPEKPSPPGLHYAMYKQTHLIFSSPDPVDSPLYYQPTKVNYGILYANYGFFLHDAYWRRKFGPGSNLPHYDPAAFNGGSHGCINFKENDMARVYDWTPVGSPIIVY